MPKGNKVFYPSSEERKLVAGKIVISQAWESDNGGGNGDCPDDCSDCSAACDCFCDCSCTD